MYEKEILRLLNSINNKLDKRQSSYIKQAGCNCGINKNSRYGIWICPEHGEMHNNDSGLPIQI